MSRANDASNLDHHALADGALEAVTGGTKCAGGSAGGSVTFRALAKALGELEQAQATNVR